jgi:Glyoxalase-like domain
MPPPVPAGRMRTSLVSLAATATFAAVTPAMAQQATSGAVGIDHLILAVDDLDRGMAEFARRTGVTPVKGGVHPGRGTQNALASLGDRVYVEILAPSNEAGTTADPRTTFRTLTPVGWALHTDDLPAVAQQLRDAGFTVSAILPGARARPDGVRLTWQTAAVSGASLEAAPFFISWGTGTPHPSTQSPAGCSLTSMMMSQPDPAPMRKFLASVKVAVTVDSAAARMRVIMRCPSGTVEF